MNTEQTTTRTYLSSSTPAIPHDRIQPVHKDADISAVQNKEDTNTNTNHNDDDDDSLNDLLLDDTESFDVDEIAGFL